VAESIGRERRRREAAERVAEERGGVERRRREAA
jgi:hypothetical protein